ncbi:MAG TPA: hypothetical protein PLV68_15125, partial [Ilumatobacteraceae bacterium]|nr:hypothetical protein [Ilumatobacteraceae bacterium]
MSLRDRFFTPRVLRALISPWSVIAAVAVGAASVVAGVPLAAGIAIAVGVYAVRVGVAMFTTDASTTGSKLRIDPFTLSEPWRRHVQAALN